MTTALCRVTVVATLEDQSLYIEEAGASNNLLCAVEGERLPFALRRAWRFLQTRIIGSIDLHFSPDLSRARRAEIVEGFTWLLRRSLKVPKPQPDPTAGAIIHWQSDATGVTYINEVWRTLTGRDPAQDLGFASADAIHPKDRRRIATIYQQAYERAQPFSYSYRVRDRGGEYLWLNGQGRPDLGPDGEVAGYTGTAFVINGAAVYTSARAGKKRRTKPAN